MTQITPRWPETSKRFCLQETQADSLTSVETSGSYPEVQWSRVSRRETRRFGSWRKKGIRAERIARVAQADLLSSGEATTLWADVFVVVLYNAPILLVSDELNDFRWWDPTLELWNGLNILDAEVIRRTHK